MDHESDNESGFDLASGIAAFEAKHFGQAARLLSPLAAAGEPEALYRMAVMAQNGLGVIVNVRQAFDFMQQAAEAGLGLAQHGLGFMFLEGECTDPDPDQAVQWFTRAAEQGLQGSMATLAMMYREGRGVTADPERARYWLQRAGFDDA